MKTKKRQSTSRCRRLARHGVAFTWGFAEGTFFFIVPDVWLSAIAMNSPRRAVSASFSSLVGAAAGGAVMYMWGRNRHETDTRQTLTSLPAISDAMVTRVEKEMRSGMSSMVLGPLRGTPYKIYGRTAGMDGESLPAFLAWSIPARLPRFLLVIAGTVLARHRGRKVLGRSRPVLEWVLYGAAWVGFYTWFFRNVGREGADK